MKVLPHYREGRKKPHEARWWINGRPRSKFFATKKERDRFVLDFTRELAQHGSEVFQFDKARQRQYREAERLLPGFNPMEVVRFWMEHHQSTERILMQEGVHRYLRQMELAGLSQEYRQHTRTLLNRFCGDHGERVVSAITSDQITEFVHGLPYAPITKRHARSYLSAAFKSFVRHGWLSRNPVAAVPMPKVELNEPGILTTGETEKLFRANEKTDPAICGLLALGAFAGMRASAIERLSYDELDFERRSILTRASKTKKKRRHYIHGLPDNLWGWLEQTPRKAFELTPRQIRHRRTRAFKRAGLLDSKSPARPLGVESIKPPKNCLRHSFVSYHVALQCNPGQTALLISHRNQNVLWDHYLGVAKQEDAAHYFNILPRNK